MSPSARPPPRAGARAASPAAGWPVGRSSSGLSASPTLRLGARGSGRATYAAMSVVREPLRGASARPSRRAGASVARRAAHQPRLRAREDVRRDLALVLDVAAEDARPASRTLAMSWNSSRDDERAVAAALLEAQRQVEQRVERRQRVGLRVELEPRADPEGAEREAEARALQELLDPRANLPLQLPGVGALEPDGDVGEREDAVEVDEDRDQPLAAARRRAGRAASRLVLPYLRGA